MDVGVVGNRRTTAGDLMLPVKLMEYVSLGHSGGGAATANDRALLFRRHGELLQRRKTSSLSPTPSTGSIRSRSGAARQAERSTQFLGEYGWERQGIDLVTFYRNLLESGKPGTTSLEN